MWQFFKFVKRNDQIFRHIFLQAVLNLHRTHIKTRNVAAISSSTNQLRIGNSRGSETVRGITGI